MLIDDYYYMREVLKGETMNKPKKKLSSEVAKYVGYGQLVYWYPADEMDAYVRELAKRVLPLFELAPHEWGCNIQKWGFVGNKCNCSYAGILAELEQLAKGGEDECINS